STRVDFPWSMCPAVPRTIRWISDTPGGSPRARSDRPRAGSARGGLGRRRGGIGLLAEEEDPLAVPAGDDLLRADETHEIVRRDLDEAPLAPLRLDPGERLPVPRREDAVVEGEDRGLHVAGRLLALPLPL